MLLHPIEPELLDAAAPDLVARLALEPAEMPIGVVTAFLGAPFFVLILRTTRRSR